MPEYEDLDGTLVVVKIPNKLRKFNVGDKIKYKSTHCGSAPIQTRKQPIYTVQETAYDGDIAYILNKSLSPIPGGSTSPSGKYKWAVKLSQVIWLDDF